MRTFKYHVTFYDPYDDGSHPDPDQTLFDTPAEAFDYAHGKVDAKWDAGLARSSNPEWFKKAVEKDIFIVEVTETTNDNG